jgi:hypothetical protein
MAKMSLADWRLANPSVVVQEAPTGWRGVYYRDGNADLWHLTDYVVHCVAASMIGLCPVELVNCEHCGASRRVHDDCETCAGLG